MKLTQNKTNVNAPAGAYPFGDIKNNTGSNDGTPVNRELITDYVQFFEKIFDMSGLTANGLSDNDTDGFQLVQALFAVVPKKFVKEFTLQGDGETVVITKSEIQASFGPLGYFHKGFLGTSTNQDENVDFCINVWVRANPSADWERLRDDTVGGQLSVVVDFASGDITLTINIAPFVDYECKVVIIG